MVDIQEVKRLIQLRINYWEDECVKNDLKLIREGHEIYNKGYDEGEAEGQRAAYYRALDIINDQCR
jgi:hypothetical protein